MINPPFMPPLSTSLTPRELQGILGSRPRVAAALKTIHSSALSGALPDRAEGVSKSAWELLRRSCQPPTYKIIERHQSEDGTIKILLDLYGDPVETVMIPSEGRNTICVSSQSGCTRACRFCATAKLGFQRHLMAGEIVLQVLIAKSQLEEPRRSLPTNVVFMGMGEPLDNLEEVIRAVNVLVALPCPGIPPRRITVSTSGILPAIERFLKNSPAELALSLHATTDRSRSAIVPHNKSWPINTLLNSTKKALQNDNRLLFIEYLLLGGINDSTDDALRLAELLREHPCRVNLIPFNPVGNIRFRNPSEENLITFMDILSTAGIRTMIRRPRGLDVAAGCGQLAGKTDSEF